MSEPLSLRENGLVFAGGVLPRNWELTEEYENASFFRCKHGPQKDVFVIASLAREKDGKRWLHVSFCRHDRLPSWDDLLAVKNLFIGQKMKAIQVFPSVDEYVNWHPYVLHLWHCMDDDGLPDFRDPQGLI